MVNLVGENMIEGDVIYQNINDIFDIPCTFPTPPKEKFPSSTNFTPAGT